MKGKESTLLSMVLSLGVITVVAAVLLAWVNGLTAGPRAEAESVRQVEAVRKVVTEFDNNPIEDKVEMAVDGNMIAVYPARLGGEFVGAAIESFSDDGFSGRISVMYGFDKDGNVIGYEVLSHAETPGLGSKMTEWFRSPVGKRSVIGHNPAVTSMYVTKDAGGEIDGITAATITSRAFLGALRTAHRAYMEYCVTVNCE